MKFHMPKPSRIFPLGICLLGTMLPALNAHSTILWQGNFETGDISQWSTPINPAGLSVTSECVFDGKHAGKVRLTGDESFLWKGNKFLNRSEFHHRNSAGMTHEGKDTFFAFSFYLPKKLSEHKHELGYWESDKSWQQTLRFNITGSELSFQELVSSVNELGIKLTYEYQDLHDRHIISDNGWRIQLGRGLDIFEPREGRFNPAEYYQEKRHCKNCEIIYLNNK